MRNKIVFCFLLSALVISLGSNYLVKQENTKLLDELETVIQEVESKAPQSKPIYQEAVKPEKTVKTTPEWEEEGDRFYQDSLQRCGYINDEGEDAIDMKCHCEEIKTEILTASWEEYVNYLEEHYSSITDVCNE